MSGRIRTIKPELLEDAKTAELEHDEWRLFVSLLLLADDYGNLRADPRQVTGSVFWAREPSRDTRELLQRLSDVGLVTLYTVSGQPYAAITNWSRHQKVDKPSKPRVPGPEHADISSGSDSPREPSESPREGVASPRVALAPDPDPDPDQGSPTVDPARTREGTTTKVRCPPDLRLSQVEVEALAISPGIDAWSVESMSGPIVARLVSAEPRTLEQWRRSLVTALCRDWTDPSKRPKRPEPGDQRARDIARAMEAAEAKRRAAIDAAPEPDPLTAAKRAATLRSVVGGHQ